jgi:hypothetical protein
VTGEPLFLWVFDAADNMAIDTIWQKYNNIRDGKPSSGEFLPDSGKLYQSGDSLPDSGKL